MSNYLNKGKRIQARKDKKEVKHHTKEFYKIIAEIDRVSDIITSDEKLMSSITEDNMEEVIGKFTDIEIGNLEKFILKGKLGLYHSLNGDIEKAKENGKDIDQ